jgi:hypothetical protein
VITSTHGWETYDAIVESAWHQQKHLVFFAPALQARGQEFEYPHVHHFQLIRPGDMG